MHIKPEGVFLPVASTPTALIAPTHRSLEEGMLIDGLTFPTAAPGAKTLAADVRSVSQAAAAIGVAQELSILAQSISSSFVDLHNGRADLEGFAGCSASVYRAALPEAGGGGPGPSEDPNVGDFNVVGTANTSYSASRPVVLPDGRVATVVLYNTTWTLRIYDPSDDSITNTTLLVYGSTPVTTAGGSGVYQLAFGGADNLPSQGSWFGSHVQIELVGNTLHMCGFSDVQNSTYYNRYYITYDISTSTVGTAYEVSSYAGTPTTGAYEVDVLMIPTASDACSFIVIRNFRSMGTDYPLPHLIKITAGTWSGLTRIGQIAWAAAGASYDLVGSYVVRAHSTDLGKVHIYFAIAAGGAYQVVRAWVDCGAATAETTALPVVRAATGLYGMSAFYLESAPRMKNEGGPWVLPRVSSSSSANVTMVPTPPVSGTTNGYPVVTFARSTNTDAAWQSPTLTNVEVTLPDIKQAGRRGPPATHTMLRMNSTNYHAVFRLREELNEIYVSFWEDGTTTPTNISTAIIRVPHGGSSSPTDAYGAIMVADPDPAGDTSYISFFSYTKSTIKTPYNIHLLKVEWAAAAEVFNVHLDGVLGVKSATGLVLAVGGSVSLDGLLTAMTTADLTLRSEPPVTLAASIAGTTTASLDVQRVEGKLLEASVGATVTATTALLVEGAGKTVSAAVSCVASAGLALDVRLTVHELEASVASAAGAQLDLALGDAHDLVAAVSATSSANLGLTNLREIAGTMSNTASAQLSLRRTLHAAGTAFATSDAQLDLFFERNLSASGVAKALASLDLARQGNFGAAVGAVAAALLGLAVGRELDASAAATTTAVVGLSVTKQLEAPGSASSTASAGLDVERRLAADAMGRALATLTLKADRDAELSATITCSAQALILSSIVQSPARGSVTYFVDGARSKMDLIENRPYVGRPTGNSIESDEDVFVTLVERAVPLENDYA